MAKCDVCFRQCEIGEGKTGFCGARTCVDGRVIAGNYARVTSAALDPIEKKPLKMFRPGKKVLSVGSYGCNLRCPFCQNNEISWGERMKLYASSAEEWLPAEIVAKAIELEPVGNIGIAYTYNEPLVGYEFVRDTAKLAQTAKTRLAICQQLMYIRLMSHIKYQTIFFCIKYGFNRNRQLYHA